MGNSRKMTSVALISVPVGRTPNAITYSFVFDEAYWLAKKGIDIHLVRPKTEKAFFSYGIHFHGLENVSRIKSVPLLFTHLTRNLNIGCFMTPRSLFYLAKYASAVTNVINLQNIDLIHAHFVYPEGFVGLLAKKETKKPLVITVHGCDILVEPSVGYGMRRSKRMDYIIRKVLNEADAVMTASNVTFNEVCKVVHDPNKVHLIPNGVDVQKFNPTLEGSRIRKKLGIEGFTVIFALKGHEPTYGLEYLIRSIPIVTKKRDDVVFVIAGDGSLRYYHEQLATKLGIKEKIIFTGRLPRNEVPSYCVMSDIVVVPSLQEAFGLIVSEAMACGKPVVGTKVGGISDQIVDGYTGFLVQPKNPLEIAEKILWLINNPEQAKKMGFNGRKIVEENFDITKRIASISNLYMNLVSYVDT